MKQAQRGGETGMNGEHYEGGQFLPNTTMGKKPATKRTMGTGKQEVAPYVWEVAPEGMISLYRKWSTFWVKDGESFKATDNTQVLGYYQVTKAEAQTAADKFNAGERWTAK